MSIIEADTNTGRKPTELVDLPASVVQRHMDVPGTPTPDGKLRCPMPSCDRTFATSNGLGPHKRAHAQRAGLMPKRRSKGTASGKWQEQVACPHCESVLLRKSVEAHLRSTHDIETLEAKRQATELPGKAKGRKPGRKPKAKVEAELAKVERALPVEEVATAMLLKMTGADSVPMTKLPAVVNWIDDTRALIAQLLDG